MRHLLALLALLAALAALTAVSRSSPPPEATPPTIDGVRLGRGRVTALAARGDALAVGTGAGVWLLDAATGDLRWHAPTLDPVTALAFEGELLAASTAQGIGVWRAASGEPVALREGLLGGVSDVAFSGGHLLATTFSGALLTFDPLTLDLLRHANTGGPAASLAVNGDRVAVGLALDGESPVQLFDSFSGRRVTTLEGHDGPVRALAWSPEGQLISGSDDDTLILWDLDTKAPAATLRGHSALVWEVAAAEGRIVSASRDGTVIVWEGGQEVARIEPGEGDVLALALMPQGVALATSADRVSLWVGGERQWSVAHHAPVESVAWLDEDRVVGGLNEGTLAFYDVDSAQQPTLIGGQHAAGVEGLAAQGGTLVSVSGLLNGSDYALNLWQGESVACTLEGLYTAAFSPDGARILAANGPLLTLYDAQTCTAIEQLPITHNDAIREVAWSARRVASAAQDGTLTVWNADPLTPQFTLKIPAAFATSVTWAGDYLAAGHRGGVSIWRGEVLTARLDFGPSVWVSDVAAHGSTIAAARDDGLITLVDARTGRTIRTLRGHAAGVNGVGWSSTGRLASASGDGTIIIWEIDP